MTDIDELMRRAVEDQPPLSITRQATLAAGRRSVRRRRILVAGACLSVLVVTGGVALTLDGRGPAVLGGAPVAEFPTYPVPQLPAAPDVPGALERPDLVGTDPLVVHFSVDTSAWPLAEAVYSSSEREAIEVMQAGGLTVTVTRSQAAAERAFDPQIERTDPPTGGVTPSPSPGTRSTSPTTVDGHPATLASITFPDGAYPYFGVIWQPVDGLWVVVFTQTKTGEAELWSDVAALRMDRAQRVVVPFELTDLPPGAQLSSCVAGVPAPGEPYTYASVSFTDASGNSGYVSIGQTMELAAPPEGPPSVSRTVNGHEVTWWSSTTGSDSGFYTDDFDGVPLILGVTGEYGEAEATRILTGLRMSANLTDPLTWPATPIPQR